MQAILLRASTVMLALAVVALLTCVAVRDSRTRRRRAIVTLLAAGPDGTRPRPRSARVRRSIVLELADRLRGASLQQEAPWVADVLSQASRDLRSRRWVRRARGLRTLHPLGIGDAVVRDALVDPDRRVRALAAGLASGRSDPRLLARLVRLLEDPTPTVRHAALDALTRRGPAGAQALRTALAATDVLPRGQLEDHDGPGGTGAPTPGTVLVGVPAHAAGSDGTLPRPLRATALPSDRTRTLLLVLRACAAAAEETLLPATRRFLDDARPEVRAAAVHTLAALGEHAALLLALVDDPDGRVRAEAVSAVGRLGARSLAGRVAVALSDRDHGVRTAAARALARLDAAGRLLLQTAVRGRDPYAADAARYALDLPPQVRAGVAPRPPDGTDPRPAHRHPANAA